MKKRNCYTAKIHSIKKKSLHQEGIVRLRRKLEDRQTMYRIVNDLNFRTIE